MRFFENRKPPLVGMISAKTKNDVIFEITNSLYDGADAIGIQLDHIRDEFKTRESLTEMFNACGGLPIYITSYKGGESANLTYDQCADLLFTALELGADLLDVPCDFYGKGEDGICYDEEIIAKQKKLITDLHAKGGKVLMSCHHSKELPREEILKHAWLQVDRGADVVKIVARCESEDKILEHLETIKILKNELPVPFLYLTSGPRKYAGIIRQLGPVFGVCMYLCVAHHDEGAIPLQPKLRAIKQVRDNMFF